MDLATVWLVTALVLALATGLLVTAYNKRGEEIKAAQAALHRATAELSSVNETLFRVQQVWQNETGLIPIAMEYVRKLDKQPQAGEWKYHQAYAAMTKDQRCKDQPGWKLGLAIHQALAELRTA